MKAGELSGTAPPPSSALAVAGTVRRLCELLDEETRMLRGSAAVDLKEFNRRKQQGVLELDCALRAMGPGAAARDISPLLATLRGKLSDNLQVLGLHLEAMREVSELMRRCIRRAESDGTYDRRIDTAGPPR